MAICALALASAVGRAGAQDLAEYLERLGLSRLLVEHYERELAGGALGDDRVRIVERLAEAYPELIERESDAARRARFIERSEAFLARESPKEADALRAALLRARYRDAARTAEDLRAALVDDAKRGQALATLEAVGEQAARLRARLDARQRDLERRADRANGIQGDIALERADRARGLAQECASLEAWSLYYQAVLTGDARRAEAAQPLFGRLLDATQNFPTPKDVSVDLRANEFYAEAILGMALAKSRTESIATTLEWLALLEEPRTVESIRSQLPVWRLVAAIDRGEWGHARGQFAAIAANPASPTAWIRIAAVGGLRAAAGTRDLADARRLAREAIAVLASRRELAHVADLARRFGDDALGGDGFAALYVRGVLRYEAGREAKRAGDAAGADSAFSDAIEAFERALAAPDAAQFAAAAGTARGLVGWSRFELGRFEEALVAFDAASDAAGGRDEESEWMALVSLERLIEAAGGDIDPVRAEDLSRRIDRFLALFPSSGRVGQLLQRRATLQGVPRRDDLERLLAADESSPKSAEGRRQAVSGYYRLYRAADSSERAAIGRRFLEVARSLPAREGALAALPGGDPTLGRQVLEVALAPEIGDADFAEAVLAAFDALIAAGTLEITFGGRQGFAEIEAELAVRRVQLELARGRPIEALARLGELEGAGPDFASQARLARRHVFRWASAKLVDGASTAPRDAVLSAAWRSGIELVDRAAVERGSLATALDDPLTTAIADRVFTSGVELFVRGGDAQLGERALALGEALLAKRPKDAGLLEGVAALAAPLGRRERAAECLRLLVAGSSVGSDRWYRSKIAFIDVLAEIDPRRARVVLDQHKAMQPDYGPGEFGEALRRLDARLPQAREAEEGSA
jgi:hypothetical protein